MGRAVLPDDDFDAGFELGWRMIKGSMVMGSDGAFRAASPA